MVDVVLVFPITGMDVTNSSIALPLSLLHISSLLDKKGYRIKIVDQRVSDNWAEEMKSTLRDNLVICVGISSMTGAQIKGGLNAARIVRNTNRNIPIVWGGVHPSLLPEQTISDELVDIAVVGEGEETFYEVVEHLACKKPLNSVKGIYFKQNGEIISTGRREFMDISEHCCPPYHLIDIKKYFINLYQSRKTLSLLTAKGCGHRCSYCYNQVFNDKKWRGIKPKAIVREVRTLIDFGAEVINLVDDNFFMDKKRVEEFCDILKDERIGVDFTTNCRIDDIVKFNKQFLKKLKEAGFNELFLGVESGSNRVLNFIKKDITVEQVIEADKKMKDSGITPLYSFMAGFPGETWDDIRNSIGLMTRLVINNSDSFLPALKIFTPFPGTELFEACKKYGFTPPQALADWASYNYNSAQFRWASKKKTALLERISYITYFLDQKAMLKHFGRNFLLKQLIKIYSKLVILRCKKHIYGFMPEVRVMKLYHKMLTARRLSCIKKI